MRLHILGNKTNDLHLLHLAAEAHNDCLIMSIAHKCSFVELHQIDQEGETAVSYSDHKIIISYCSCLIHTPESSVVDTSLPCTTRPSFCALPDIT